MPWYRSFLTDCPSFHTRSFPPPCSKFLLTFDDASQGRFFLQQEQWEPLDLELLQVRI